jgi:tRNA 2-selenouridine synthase
MKNVTQSTIYLDLFLNDIPIMDVRAPVEYDRGAFPHATNVPLLDDAQREVIGKRYKDAGQDEAIKLGLELFTPEIKNQRLLQWEQFTRKHPGGYLYCFRGGLRSRTTQAWLKEQGINYPLIQGGYKAMRQFLLDQLEISHQEIPFVILTGLTGSGKTHVLKKMTFHVDLEGLANHRGSAFGRDVNDFQPSQINFENELSIALLKHRHRYPSVPLVLEDEGKMIGRNYLTVDFYNKMVHSPRIFLQRDLEQRIRITSDDYFGHAWPIYQDIHGIHAKDKFTSYALDSLSRIKKRLGADRYNHIHLIFTRALEQLFDSGRNAGFDEGVRILLEEYYDPMYRYQLEKKPVEVIFSGDEQAILEWAREKVC